MKALPLAFAAWLALPGAAPATAAAAAAPADPQVQRSQPAPLRIPDAGRFRDWDRNNDGVITRSEWRGTAQEFRDLDWNRDGMLSGDEVRDVARSRYEYEDPDTTIDEDFDWLDRNNDNRIARGEWTGTLAEFNRLDRNRDGWLSRGELNRYDQAVRTGAYDSFEEIDRDGNGVIARNEWHGSRASFNEYDLNRDNRISRYEYDRVQRDDVVRAGNTNVMSRLVAVDSREQWTDTGIYVQAGDIISYRADGTIQMSTNSRDLATPAGSTTGRNAKNSPRPDRSAGGLVVRIGDASPGFLGASGSFTAQNSGELLLGVNDDYLGDNSGSYRVSIDVQSNRYRY